MNGTSHSHTRAIDLIPPRITTAVNAVMIAPVSHGVTRKVSWTIDEIEFAWTMLPMPKAAIAVSAAKTVPSHGTRSPRASTYIGPPAIVPSGVVIRYFTASTASPYLVAIPKTPVSHIQRTAPGPPDADDVPRPDGRGERGRERAEVAHVAFALAGALERETDRAPDVALDEAEAYGQVEMRPDQQDEERRAPDPVTERAERRLEAPH